mgnify:CR=1 FL=1
MTFSNHSERIRPSPLSRGIRIELGDCKVTVRIIPALAGNTRAALVSLSKSGDHPRSRGEYSQALRRLA